MKKYYKMFSFFTEKRNIKFIVSFLFVLCVFLVPKNTYALSSVNYGTQQFSTDLSTELSKYIKFNNIGYYSSSNSPDDNSYLFVAFSDNEDDTCFTGRFTSGAFNFKNSSGVFTSTRILRTTISRIDTANTFQDILFSVPTSDNNIAQSYSRVYANYAIKYCSDTSLTVGNNVFTYTPPSNECEECQECQECEGGGPVEVSNFPISNNEFICLLVLLAVLILMLFFKWCFPMKGGKNK